MAGSQTDVQLVIKAQDQATTAVNAVVKAISSLTSAQDGLAKGGGEVSSLLDELKNASTALAAALQKTDEAAVNAQAAFERQQKTLAETQTQLAAVKVQMEAADSAAASLNAQIAAGGEVADIYKMRLAGVVAEQKNLTAQSNTLTRAIATQQAALAKSGSTVQQTQTASKTAGSAATFGVVPPEAAADMEKATEAAQRLSGVLPAIAPAAKEAAQGTRSLWTELTTAAGAMFAIPAAASGAGESVSSFGGRSSAATQATHLFRYELLSLALAFIGPYGVVSAIEGILKAYQDLQTAQNKLGVVFNQNNQEVATQLDFLRSTAIKLGLSFGTLADQYSTIAVSAQDAGLSLADTQKLFLAIADASRVLHLSTEDVNNVFLAFREMLSKGEIQSVQLVKQLGTDMPAATQLFANALGVSEAKLLSMMKAGQVFADSDTMTKVADRLTAKYGAQLPAALQSTQTQIGRLQTLLELAAQQIGQSGFMDGLNAALKDLNTQLQSSSGREVFAEVGTALGKIAGIIPFIVDNFGVITTALKAWAAVKLSGWVTGFVQSLGALYVKLDGAIALMDTVAGTAKAMWAAISGVVIGGAVFALETVLGEWLTGIDSATTALNEHDKILEAIRKGYQDAGGAVDQWAAKIKEASSVQIRANLTTLQNQLAQQRQNVPAIPASLATFGGAVPDSAQFGKLDSSTGSQLTGLGAQLNDIIQKFKDGQSSAEAFKAAVNSFAEAHPEFREFAAQLLAGADSATKLEAAINDMSVALRVSLGKGTPGDIKQLGLDAATGWDGATTAAGKYADALDKLNKLGPDKAENVIAGQLTQAKSLYDQAVKDAGNDPALLQQALLSYNKVVAFLRAKATADAASAFPVDNKAIIERIIYVEGGYAAKNNPASSANGVGQFTDATWLQYFNQLFPKLSDMTDAAKLALRANADVAQKILAAETQSNQLELAKAGIPTTPANTYLAHFLGAAGAIKMIVANPDELASKIASAAAVKANPSILGGSKTAGDVVSSAQSKMGGLSPITSSGATQMEVFNSKLDETIQGWKDSTAAMTAADAAQKQYGDAAQRVLFIQEKINDAEKEAKAAGGALSAARIQEITAVSGALYDVQHKAQDAQKAVDDVVGLSEQRATAIKDLQNSFQDGSSADAVEALKQKVAELTAQILALLPNAQAMVTTVGNPKMAEALDKVNLSLKTLKTGLTDAKAMNLELAGDLATAWGGFLQTLGQSSKVLLNLRNAFLQFVQTFLSDISQMIIKQDLLNALSGTNIGKSIADFVNGATGTDGAGAAALTGAGTVLSTAGEALNAAAFALQGAAATLAGSGGSMTGGLASIFPSLFGSDGQMLGDFGASGIPSFLTDAASMPLVFHSGGIVGMGGTPRPIASSIFAGAKRFHRGGLPGLRPNEIPAILERGEEVLTRSDARHAMNGGAGSSPIGIKIINTMDAGDVLSQALNTPVGHRALVNHIRANKSAVNVALG